MALAGRLDSLYATRRTLLSRVRNPDDHESWEDFFKTYSRLVYSMALKARLSDAEAQDVVQETFIALAKQMPKFRYDPDKGRFKNWLIKTTQNKIYDHFRKKKPELLPKTRTPGGTQRTSTIERIPDPASLNLDDLCEQEWRQHVFQQAVEKVKLQVNASQFQIFDLYVLKEWPVRRIASTLGISRTRVYLAKHRLLKLVEHEVKLLQEEFRISAAEK